MYLKASSLLGRSMVFTWCFGNCHIPHLTFVSDLGTDGNVFVILEPLEPP